MASRAFRLDMKSPLHVGEMGIGQEETLDYIPSDTLFGALVTTWLEMGRSDLVDGLPGWAERKPSLLLTSAFPCLGERLFYPRPRLLLQPKEGGKAFKKIRWVSASVFAKLIDQPTQQSLDALWSQEQVLAGEVWVDVDEETSTDSLWQAMRVPKVTVDRVSNASTLFHVGRIHFADEAGLWFAAQGDEEWLDAVEEALNLLADSGIGGQRSRGNGRFVPSRLPDPGVFSGSTPATDYQVLLSRLAPTADQMNALRQPQSSYQLVTIGGWANTPGDNPLIRKRVRMLAEGSIVGGGQLGQLVDVNPNSDIVRHPIYRYGYGLGVSVQLAGSEGGSQ